MEKKLFEITVVEKLKRTVLVEAKNKEEAINKIQKRYDNTDIVLDYNDFTDFDISAREVM